MVEVVLVALVVLEVGVVVVGVGVVVVEGQDLMPRPWHAGFGVDGFAGGAWTFGPLLLSGRW